MDAKDSIVSNFYLWEQRGRGWTLWNQPVEPEPSFVPFFYHQAVYEQSLHAKHSTEAVSHSEISWVVDKVKKLFFKPKKNLPVQESLEEPLPIVANHPGQLFKLVLSVPQQLKIDSASSLQLLEFLGATRASISFEVVADYESIIMQLVVPGDDAYVVKHHIEAYFPHIGVVVSPLENAMESEAMKNLVCVDLGLEQEFMRPLNMNVRFQPDPFQSILASCESLDKGERVMIQILFQGVINPWSPSIVRAVSDGRGGSFFEDAPEMLPLAKRKVSRPLIATVVRLCAFSDLPDRSGFLLHTLLQSIKTVTASPENSLVPLSNSAYPLEDQIADLMSRRSRRYGMLLNVDELANLVHIPSPSVTSRKFRIANGTTVSAPPPLTQERGVLVGINRHLGKELSVKLNVKQRLRHTHIIGATGTGKSTLLVSMVTQDIEIGRGVTVLDPHGDLIDHIIARIPEHRMNDVILLDPSDEEYAIGLNLLRADTELEKMVLSSDLTGLFRRFASSWGDQMNTILANAINAFLEHPEGGTLMELKRFLVEIAFRKKILAKVTDSQVRYFWEREYPLLRKGSIASLLTRLDTFLRPKIVRAMMAQKSGISFHEILSEQKIVLIKLSQGTIGEENSFLLGSLIVAKLHQAAQARQKIPESERHPHILYLDEFQNFITPSMEAILSGARKFGLGMVLAHQNLQQLFGADTNIGNAVVGNVGIRISFRLGELDAQKLEKGFAHFSTQDLQNLGVGEAIVRADRSDHDANIVTFLLEKVPEEQVRKMMNHVIDHSRKNYGKRRNEIDYSFGAELKDEEVKTKSIEEKAQVTDKQKKAIVPEEPQDTQVKAGDSPKRNKTEQSTIAPIADKTPSEFEQVADAYLKEEAQRQEKREHIRIQEHIKQVAQSYGFGAVIEEAIANPPGRVDVGIDAQGVPIAVEVAVTNLPTNEVGNIRKCINAGYQIVIVCSDHSKHLEKIESLATNQLSSKELDFVFFCTSSQTVKLLDTLALQYETLNKPKTTTVNGYRVRVNYDATEQWDVESRRDSILKMVVGRMRK